MIIIPQSIGVYWTSKLIAQKRVIIWYPPATPEVAEILKRIAPELPHIDLFIEEQLYCKPIGEHFYFVCIKEPWEEHRLMRVVLKTITKYVKPEYIVISYPLEAHPTVSDTNSPSVYTEDIFAFKLNPFLFGSRAILVMGKRVFLWSHKGREWHGSIEELPRVLEEAKKRYLEMYSRFLQRVKKIHSTRVAYRPGRHNYATYSY